MQKNSKWSLSELGTTLKKYRYLIVGLGLSFLMVVYSDYNLATGSGNLCMVLFCFANTYVPAKRLRFLFNFKNVAHYFNVYLGYHCLANIAAFLVMVFHCYVSNWVNLWLKVAVVLMGALVIGGFLLKFQYSAALKRGVYYLHSQQLIFLLLLYALLKGHYVI